MVLRVFWMDVAYVSVQFRIQSIENARFDLCFPSLPPPPYPMKSTRKHHRLGSYLAASVILGTFASSAQAAIVNLDVSSLAGPNAGLPEGTLSTVLLQTLSPGAPNGTFIVANTYDPGDQERFVGIVGVASSTEFAASGPVLPTNFPSGALIGATAFPIPFGSSSPLLSLFRVDYQEFGSLNILESPDFGTGSHMGFRVAELDLSNNPTGNFYYGWLEVTWEASTRTFEILSGAVNTTLNQGITAGGGGVSAIPEPSGALGTLGVLAAGMMIRRRRSKAA